MAIANLNLWQYDDPFINERIEDFSSFMAHYPIDPCATHLNHYLDAWIDEGDAVERTGGNWETFLVVSFFVADAVMRDPDILTYVPANDEPSVPRVVQGLASNSTHFDRRRYEVRAFQIANAGRGMLVGEPDPPLNRINRTPEAPPL